MEEGLITSDTADEKSRKRSQRVQLACVPCRHGKLKCNREYPACDQCYKRSRESSCIYTERGLRYNAAKHKAENMREKVDRLEAFVTHLKQSKAAAKGTTTEVSVNKSSADDGEDETASGLSPLTGNLILSDSGSTQFVGPSHWESIIDDISDVKTYFEIESSPGVSESDESRIFSNSDVIPVDIIFGISQGYTKQDLLRIMPQKSEMDRLVAAWFNAVDVYRLILHGPTFQKQYQRFWLDPRDVSSAWLALLFSVAALGAVVSGQARQDAATLARGEDLRRLTAHALVHADYTASQPYVIEAFMLYEKSLLLTEHDTTRRIWQLHGQIMRLCFQAGYHRDPGSNSAISTFNCEMRRRVWMFACEYDILTSYQVGMTSLINRSMCDTARPANLIDSDLSMESMPSGRPLEEYTSMQMALCYSNLTDVFADVTFAGHTLKFPKMSDTKSLQDRLDNSRGSLPQKLKMVPIDDSFTDSPELILDRLRLEILYWKTTCILYRPYLGRREYEREYQYCLDAAETLVRTQIPMLEAGHLGGQLSGCTPFLRRHVHDFNLAAMLLCSELKRRSISDLVPANRDISLRIRRLLLQACGLWSLEGITSPKARHAIRAIERFLLQDTKTPGGFQSLAISKAFGPNDNAAGGYVNTSVPLEQESKFPADYGTIPSNEAMDGFQEAFNIVQDPMFQDLFGPSYYMPDGLQTDWT